MTRALALLLLLAVPAHAGDTAGPPVQEPPLAAWVLVVDVFGPVDLFNVRNRPPCSLNHPCTGPSLTAPPLAPVPVPPAGLLLALGLVGLWRMKNE